MRRPHLLHAPHALPHVGRGGDGGRGGHGGGLDGPLEGPLVMLRKTESSSPSKNELYAKSSPNIIELASDENIAPYVLN